MKTQANVWTRLVCLLHGEVAADTREAYRRASLAVLDLLDQAEQERGTPDYRNGRPEPVDGTAR